MVVQMICFKESIWNKGLRYSLCTHKSIIKPPGSPSLLHYKFSSSIFEVSLLGWPSYTSVKGQRTEMGNCRVGFSDILSLTKIDIVFHLSLNHLHAQILASPSLEVSLSSTFIIRHQAFRVDAGWNRGGVYSREQQIYIAGTFRGYSTRLKVLGLIEYVCRGAATLTRKCAGMFTSVTTNDVPSELFCQMMCWLGPVAKCRERFTDKRNASRCNLKLFRWF